MSFKFSRQVHLYETDLMGVVHHSNYVRYLEEARFAWLRHENLLHLHGVEQNCLFAVIDLQISYKSPLKWGDAFEVEVTVKQVRSRIYFESIIRALRNDNPLIVKGVVVTACVNNRMEPIRPPKELQNFLNREGENGSQPST